MRKSLAKSFIVLLIFITCVCTCFSCSQSKIKIEFVVDGEVYHTLELEDDVVILFPEKPEKEGYVFLGWYFDSRGESDILKSDYLLKNDSVGNKIKVYAIFERDREVHLHHFVATVVPPTCESVGYTEYACSCNDKYREDEVPKKGHKFENYIYNNDSSCEVNGTESAVCANGCGEINTRIKENSALAHSYTRYTSNHDATYDSDGTKTAYCDNGCGKTSTVVDEGSKLIPGHVHEYDREVVLDIYKVRSATCVSKATYNKSCECGARGDEIFETGDLLPHNYENYLFDNNATCDVDGTKTAYCTMGCGESDVKIVVGSRLGHKFENYIYNNDSSCEVNGTESAVCANGCGEIDRREKENSALAHSFTKYISNHDATYDSDGTKTANCDNGCGKTSTVVDEGSKLVYSAIEFKSFNLSQNEASKSVAYAVDEIDFTEEIEVYGYAIYTVSSDEEGKNIYPTKVAQLQEGGNKFYLTWSVNGVRMGVYDVEIYRNHLYTVTFNTLGGSAIEEQKIEEGSLVSRPKNPEREYFDFLRWEFDFSMPVYSDMVIDAVYELEPNAASYTVEYHLENVFDDGYTLSETETRYGYIGESILVKYKNIENFEATYNSYRFTLSEGSVARLKYKRVKHNVILYDVEFNTSYLRQVKHGGTVSTTNITRDDYHAVYDRPIENITEDVRINFTWVHDSIRE